MANPEHVKIVEQGEKAIEDWRDANPGITLDLSGADLSKADLLEADLSKADLKWANLSRAGLLVANLSGANLSDAGLLVANLSGANLSDADLSGANLNGTNLTEANLNGANLSGAGFFGTTAGGLDLSTAAGLAEANHTGPSHIDVQTIQATAVGLSGNESNRGPIEAFFKAAGVPDEILSVFHSWIGKPIEFYSVFISYSHADRSFARRLYDSLQRKGIRCWLDEHEIEYGDDMYRAVDRGIRLWDKVLLCCTKDSLTSWWVERELDTAFEKEERIRKDGREVLAIIPLNLDGYLFDWDGSHAAALRKRLAADFTGWESDNAKFESVFEKLVQALRSGDTGRKDPPKSKMHE